MQGDTLRSPKILQNGEIAKFDCVIANPPFSLEKWGSVEWSSDKYGRNVWGTPSDSCGDYAWIQHMVKVWHPAMAVWRLLCLKAYCSVVMKKAAFVRNW